MVYTYRSNFSKSLRNNPAYPKSIGEVNANSVFLATFAIKELPMVEAQPSFFAGDI